MSAACEMLGSIDDALVRHDPIGREPMVSLRSYVVHATVGVATVDRPNSGIWLDPKCEVSS